MDLYVDHPRGRAPLRTSSPPCTTAASNEPPLLSPSLSLSFATLLFQMPKPSRSTTMAQKAPNQVVQNSSSFSLVQTIIIIMNEANNINMQRDLNW